MQRITITLPPDAELIELGRRAWLTQHEREADRLYRACIERLPTLLDKVVQSSFETRHGTLQDLAACVINARTQWERIHACAELAGPACAERAA